MDLHSGPISLNELLLMVESHIPIAKPGIMSFLCWKLVQMETFVGLGGGFNRCDSFDPINCLLSRYVGNFILSSSSPLPLSLFPLRPLFPRRPICCRGGGSNPASYLLYRWTAARPIQGVPLHVTGVGSSSGCSQPHVIAAVAVKVPSDALCVS